MATIYYEPSGCNCDNKTTYDKAAINAACTEALKLASEKRTLGRDKYPHVYNDYEKFDFSSHAKKPYLEFPIMANGAKYSGESPGADRVIIGSIATDYQSAVYCATLTHDGTTRNGFTECSDDTMNPNGKGSYKRRIEGRGKEPVSGRKLLERIDL
ncbi:putative ribonuclease T1 [Coleophoma cylindrospora]|uniref:ribonuclease T1 n=1 Tax=Coleophoma cylindrospora TaxID=1849047 RepID=A0A3D8QEL5_9HELO|nr:putative ribonuclease T1 [Coleophoma cylindrospora]